MSHNPTPWIANEEVMLSSDDDDDDDGQDSAIPAELESRPAPSGLSILPVPRSPRPSGSLSIVPLPREVRLEKREDDVRVVAERPRPRPKAIEIEPDEEVPYDQLPPDAPFVKVLSASGRHPAQDGQYKCIVCQIVVETAEQLQLHRDEEYPHSIQCEFCDHFCSSISVYQGHLKVTHKRDVDHICHSCGLVLLDAGLMSKHRSNEHETSYSCSSCCFMGTTQLELLQHGKEHAQSQHGHCTLCGLQFGDLFALRRHMECGHLASIESQLDFKCHACDLVTKDPAELRKHWKSGHADEDVYCDQCPESCTSVADLRRHVATEHAEMNEKLCPDCGFLADGSQLSWTQHWYRVHTQLEPALLKCNECSFATLHEDVLKAHAKAIHMPDSAAARGFGSSSSSYRFTCPICRYFFQTSSDMNKHLMTKHKFAEHPEPRMMSTYLCLECLTLTNSAEALGEHKLKEHGGAAADFACESCQDTMPTLAELVRHRQEKHRGPTDKAAAYFACESCHVKVPTLVELVRHRQERHRAPMDTVCRECGYVNLSRDQLHLHRAEKHRVQRLFSCTLCPYRASGRFNLRQHFRMLHPTETFPCYDCGKVLKTSVALRKHVKERHKPY